MAFVTRLVKTMLLFAGIWVLLWIYSNYSLIRIKGIIMSPSLERGKFVIVRSPKRLSRGDIVLFEHELASKRGRDISLLARVIGMPGESLKIEKGIVYINGNKLFEDYVSTENMTEDNVEEFIIPKGKYFLLCDNRKAGRFYDSRSIGPVGINSIRWKLR